MLGDKYLRRKVTEKSFLDFFKGFFWCLIGLLNEVTLYPFKSICPNNSKKLV
ncbi:unnamed protein product [Meloidogyne enterolobii]|uniref:Uncharacterized protein n=1 Tax=Meloidogyne enterolobii TaxID=390850 RepID=A0ACB0ZXD8_MELEN